MVAVVAEYMAYAELFLCATNLSECHLQYDHPAGLKSALFLACAIGYPEERRRKEPLNGNAMEDMPLWAVLPSRVARMLSYLDPPNASVSLRRPILSSPKNDTPMARGTDEHCPNK